jgi:hypothetical protein
MQRLVDGKEESHLYKIHPGMTQAKHLADPIAAPDRSTDVTIFGSVHNTTGMLYLCAFNCNSILGLDLTKLPKEPSLVKCSMEIKGLALPNDVCINPKNESILYLVGGSFWRFCCCYEFSNSAFGCVYKVVLKEGQKDCKMLMGIEVVGSKLWIAQLFNILAQDETGGPTLVVRDGNNRKGDVWMVDNINTFDRDMILCLFGWRIILITLMET